MAREIARWKFTDSVGLMLTGKGGSVILLLCPNCHMRRRESFLCLTSHCDGAALNPFGGIPFKKQISSAIFFLWSFDHDSWMRN
jgi:hypothetical protein